MRRRARTVLCVLVSCLAAAALAVFIWLPWNPLEADAGPLDEWVPADVDAVVRFDARAVREAPAVRTLWDGPAGRRLRDAFDLDAKLDEILRLDAKIAAAPFVDDDPPTIERDLLGGETLVALRGDDVLALTRISGRAKAIDLIRRAGDERRAQWGIRLEGDGYVVAVGDGRDVRFARRRDVVIVSTSKELLASALALADGAGASIESDADYRAVRPAAPSGAKASAWAAGRLASRLVGKPPVAAALIRSAVERGVSTEIDLSSTHQLIVASVRSAARGTAARNVGRWADAAEDYSIIGQSFAVGALPLSADEAVRALFESQPDGRRKLVQELLDEGGSSVDAVVTDLARHLADNVGFVIARLPETDRLKLDDADGDVVEPIPATVAVFQFHHDHADPFLADLRRHASVLFGADVRLVEERGPGDSRLFVARGPSFGPEWALLTPAFALIDDRVVFSTNCEYLRSALSAPRHGGYRGSGPCVAALRLEVWPLKRRLDDLRWEVADRATYRDWAAERGAVREDLARRFPSLPVRERERREDDEIERRIDDRRRRLFPNAVRAYRESIAWLAGFSTLHVRVEDHDGALEIEAAIGLNRE